MLGGAIGQLKAKNDWEIRAWYQYAGQFALDPNLVDSDIFDSRINEKGVAVKVGYMVADAISLTSHGPMPGASMALLALEAQAISQSIRSTSTKSFKRI